MKPSYTPRQGQFLAFINHYTTLHGRPPAEWEMQQFFQVTPPSVHQMVLTLERRGFIHRVPGQARSLTLLLPPEALPPLVGAGRSIAASPSPAKELAPPAPAPDWLRLGRIQIEDLFAHNSNHPLDDSEFVPLLDVLIGSFAKAGANEPVVHALQCCAAEVYHRYCQESAPETAFWENADLMLSFLSGQAKRQWSQALDRNRSSVAGSKAGTS